MRTGTEPSPEPGRKNLVPPGESAEIARVSDQRILQELEAKIEAKMAEREANWLRGLYLLRGRQRGSEVDFL